MIYKTKRAECQMLLDSLLDGACVRRNGVSLKSEWIASLRVEIAVYDELLRSI